MVSTAEHRPFQLVAPEGTAAVDPADLDLKQEDLREMLRLMILARKLDLEATALQRQGELAVYPPLLGQEAAQVGSAYALDREDFIFPSYREFGAALVRRVDPAEYMHFHRATWHGGLYDPWKHRFGMISVPVATQILHAVGFALGCKLDRKRTCVLVYFGDGATSEGDFHEGCNFAAVFQVPVVFFCQNNHWAISVPIEQQTAAPIFKKADAYGFPGVQVDGNDVLAVYQVTREAAARAREDGIPTLIEAITYRMGPHSTADDATRYRTDEELKPWEALDPIERFQRFLETRGIVGPDLVKAFEREAAEEAARLRTGIVGAPPRPVAELFQWVYADTPPHLARQRDEVLGAGGPGGQQPPPTEEEVDGG